MKGKYIQLTMVLVLLMAFLGGTASAETYSVEIGQFQKLKVNGNFTVVYKNLPDSTGFARYEAPAGNEELYVFSTKGDGNLKVEPTDDKWGRKDLPVLYIYSDFLSGLESYSDQTVEVTSIAPCASFSVTLVGNGTINVNDVKCNNLTAAITTGNGTIFVSGKCLNANLRMVGAGLITADQLQADNVKCRILGTGSIGCWPIEKLNVTGLGSTKIYYKGRPEVKKTGGGKLFELPDEFDAEGLSKNSVEVKSLRPLPLEDEEDEDSADDEDDEEEDDDYQTVVTDDE